MSRGRREDDETTRIHVRASAPPPARDLSQSDDDQTLLAIERHIIETEIPKAPGIPRELAKLATPVAVPTPLASPGRLPTPGPMRSPLATPPPAVAPKLATPPPAPSPFAALTPAPAPSPFASLTQPQASSAAASVANPPPSSSIVEPTASSTPAVFWLVLAISAVLTALGLAVLVYLRG
jgi:hypothetical protein